MKGSKQEIAVESEYGDSSSHYGWLYERFVAWKKSLAEKENAGDSESIKRPVSAHSV